MTNEKQLELKREFSSGGSVYKKFEDGSVKWLVGKHSGYHKWVLPKGLIEPGEKGRETAVRETKEEMGVTAKIIGEKPVHTEKYYFVATLKKENNEKETGSNDKVPIRRVKTYQEDPGFAETGEDKIKVFKTVTFFLMEYVSGDPADHDWEMEDAGWYDLEEALEMLAFPGEKIALRKAAESLGG